MLESGIIGIDTYIWHINSSVKLTTGIHCDRVHHFLRSYSLFCIIEYALIDSDCYLEALTHVIGS